LHIFKNQRIALAGSKKIAQGTILMDLLFPKTLLLPAHGKFSLSRAITYLKKCYSVVFRDFLVKKAKG